jgi:hypothetical protein
VLRGLPKVFVKIFMQEIPDRHEAPPEIRSPAPAFGENPRFPPCPPGARSPVFSASLTLPYPADIHRRGNTGFQPEHCRFFTQHGQKVQKTGNPGILRARTGHPSGTLLLCRRNEVPQNGYSGGCDTRHLLPAAKRTSTVSGRDYRDRQPNRQPETITEARCIKSNGAIQPKAYLTVPLSYPIPQKGV